MRLLALLLRRLVWFVPTLLGLLAVTFVISRVVPADPVGLVAGETATPAQVAALRRELGFDRPLPDHALRVVTVSGLAIASFWLGIMLQLLFAMRLGWTPLNGRLPGFPPRPLTGFYLVDAAVTGDWPTFATALLHLALPAATLA